jgi:hypothetical protein
MYINRDEAERQVKQAVDDYLPVEQLQSILDLIYGDEFLVIENGDMPEEDEDYDT